MNNQPKKASENRSPCLMVMAGGTGGHVFPALAVAEQLQREGWRIQWLGTAGRMEASLVPKHGFDIDFIDIKGLRGNGLKRLLLAPWQILRAIWQARALIRRHRPDVVLGMGGYASGPGGVAARLSGLPLVLHEQNAVPGMTNKLLARIASQVLVAFPQAFAAVEGRKVVGNPVRQALFDLAPVSLSEPETEAPGGLKLLVMGGSLGAKVLNETVPAAVARLRSEQGADFALTVRHQCGAGHLATTEAAYGQSQPSEPRIQVSEFIDDIPAALGWADLVICRAGALTVSELAAAGRAGIYVPLPHAVDDHQSANARSVTDQGGGILLPQRELSAAKLAQLLRELAAAPEIIEQMAQAARGQARPQACEQVAAVCRNLAGDAGQR